MPLSDSSQAKEARQKNRWTTPCRTTRNVNRHCAMSACPCGRGNMKNMTPRSTRKKDRKRNGTNYFGCGGPWRPASGATCLPLRGPSSRRNCPVDARLWFAICAYKPRRSLASAEDAQPCGARSHSSWVTASRLQGMDGIQLRWGQVRRHAIEKQCKTKAGRANRLHTTWNALIPPSRCARK